MSKYAKIKYNDIVDGKGVCVSLWTQGCPHKCFNCHNPETWNENSGYDVPIDINDKILAAIAANGIKRNFAVLGGEPLAPYNTEFVDSVISTVRQRFPQIKIYVWTGYLYEDLLKSSDLHIQNILSQIDILIDGPYIDSQRDITLDLRGSSNQRILKLKN